MGKARSLFANWLRRDVAPALRRASYTGSGQSFHRRFGDNWGIVNFQRSRWSDGSSVQFVLNLGTASGPVLAYVGYPEAKPPAEYECHWRRRVSRGDGTANVWWEIGEGDGEAKLAALGDEVRGVLLRDCLPAIEAHSSDDALLDLHLDPRATGQGGIDVAGVLLHRLGGTADQQDRFAANLAKALEWRSNFRRSPEAKPTPTGVRANIAKLNRRQPQARWEGAWRLAFASPDREVLDALRAHLDDPDPRARSGIAAALAKLGDRESLPRLLEMVRSEPGRYEAEFIAEGLGQFALRDTEVKANVEPVIRERLSRAIGYDRVALQVVLDRLHGRTSS